MCGHGGRLKLLPIYTGVGRVERERRWEGKEKKRGGKKQREGEKGREGEYYPDKSLTSSFPFRQ